MKKVIRLTESDLVRIVRKFIKEGVIVTVPPQPWNTLDTMIGEVVWTNDGGKTLQVRGYDKNGIDYNRGGFNEYTILQNPKQVEIGQMTKETKIVNFDDAKKVVTLDNGLMIGPA
jgi:hypothetical protein